MLMQNIYQQNTPPRNAGFNLVELLLAIGIIAIITTIATPNILSFFDLQKEQEETAMLDEMQKGLKAYAQENSELPAVATVFNDLQSYTGYFPNQLSTSAWGTPRVYALLRLRQQYRDASFDVDYGVILSLGENGCLNTGGAEECDADDIATRMTELIDNSSGTTILFDNLVAGGDDYLVKYTDFKDKSKNYEITSKRLERIAEALVIYAKTQRFQGIQDGEADAQEKIYFPPSDDAWPGADTVDVLYGVNVIADANAATALVDTLEPSISNGDDAEERLSDMIALMKILGLPNSNCCNAMRKVDHDLTAGTPNVEEPFYYYANPRSRLVTNPVITTDCATTEVPSLTERKNPPRITVTPDVCGTN